MSLKDITDLLETRHNNAMKVVEKMAESPEFGELQKISSSYVNNLGAILPLDTYALNKRQSLAVAAKLNTALLMRVIDRWQELEEAKPVIDPMKALSDPATMRQLLLGYTEKVIELEAKVQQQAPKVEALDRIATATDGSLCLTDAAKTLQVQPKKLNLFMQSSRWIYKRIGSSHYVGYQDKIQLGYLEHKERPIKLSDGSDKLSCQVLITAKGLAKLSGLVAHGIN